MNSQDQTRSGASASQHEADVTPPPGMTYQWVDQAGTLQTAGILPREDPDLLNERAKSVDPEFDENALGVFAEVHCLNSRGEPYRRYILARAGMMMGVAMSEGVITFSWHGQQRVWIAPNVWREVNIVTPNEPDSQ